MTRIVVAPPPRPAAPRPAQALDLPPSARALGLVREEDLGWIGALVAVVVQLEAQPWRLALDVIDSGEWLRAWRAAGERDVPRGERDVSGGERDMPSARRIAAAVEALRRMLAGRSSDIALARKARALLLGLPALTDEDRVARVVAVASELAITPAELDQVLWADLPRERPIEIPAGRPDALAVAALANVGLVQRALRHAHAVEVVIRGDAGAVLRAAAARGLLVTASQSVRDSRADASAREVVIDAAGAGEVVIDAASTAREVVVDPASARETVIDIVGPLALCHGTAVYGRALGALVPVLGGCADFTLTIHAEARGRAYDLCVATPVLLPPAPQPAAWPVVHQLARDLERLGVTVQRAPPAIARGGAVVCPDLGVEVGGRTVWIEIVGFWTPAYLARKVQRYRAAGAGEVVLCIDSTRACDDDDDAPPDGALVVRFERRIHAEPLAQLLGA